MRAFTVLALVQFCVCEKVNFEKSLFSSSSEESSESSEEDIKHGKLDINDKDLSNLELNKDSDPLNKCLSIKNQNSNCVIEVCTQKCTLLGEDTSGEEVSYIYLDFPLSLEYKVLIQSFMQMVSYLLLILSV